MATRRGGTPSRGSRRSARTVADEAERDPGHRRPGHVLQRQVRRHLPDRPALAQRRAAPLLLGQVFEQVHQGAPLAVDRGPRIAAFHGFLRFRSRHPAPACCRSRGTGYSARPRSRRGAEYAVPPAGGPGQGLQQGCDLVLGVEPRVRDGELVQHQPGEEVKIILPSTWTSWSVSADPIRAGQFANQALTRLPVPASLAPDPGVVPGLDQDPRNAPGSGPGGRRWRPGRTRR